MRPDTLAHAMQDAALSGAPGVELPSDHPGFSDAAYRARRDVIAASARRHVFGTPAPEVAYTADERTTWSTICDALRPLHARRVCSVLREHGNALGILEGPIPQIERLNGGPLRATGFRFEPVDGLVPARRFFETLAEGVFLSTQFMRHSSRPLYTPEPDVVHELVGHAASLTVPWIADLARQFGRVASAQTSDIALRKIDRVFWFTMEFGLVEEDGETRAFGAGLLSSAGELESFEEGSDLRPFDLDAMSTTDYDTDSMQRKLFVAPSIDAFRAAIAGWLAERVS
ncbi:MAG: phenylalanine 4-monooxygenase [Planctomycetota bacterium]